MGGAAKGLFGGIGSMLGGILGSKDAPGPILQPAPVAPAVADPAVQDAADAERERQKKAAGRASTDLTGGAGLLDEAVTAKKTLLGA